MLNDFQIAKCAAWAKLDSIARAQRYLHNRGEEPSALNDCLKIAAMLPEALLVEAEEAVKLRMTSPCLAVLPGKVAPIIAALARTPACCLREKAIIVWLTKINRWWHLTVEHSVILPPRPTRTTLARILMSNRYNRLPLLLAFEEAVLDWSWTQVPPTFPENAILGVGYRSQSITELHDSLSPF